MCIIIAVLVRPSVRGQLVKMLMTLELQVYFDQIMHYSAGNDQFAFHTFLVAPDTGRALYGRLICILSHRKIPFPKGLDARCVTLCRR